MPGRKKSSRAKRNRQSGEGISDVIRKIGRVARKVYSGVKSANDWARKNKIISTTLRNPLAKLAGKTFGVDTASYANQADQAGYGRVRLHRSKRR